jgi:hypothetical protein
MNRKGAKDAKENQHARTLSFASLAVHIAVLLAGSIK